jgi:hypothetical protein
MISDSQRSKFFALQHRAWLADCERARRSPDNREQEEAWRHDEMRKLLGIESVRDLDPIEGFERLMFHWAEITGDDAEIAYWASALERRYKHVIRAKLDELSRVEQKTVSWAYVCAIAYRMHLPLSLDECPADMLWPLLQALDTHIRRLRRQQSEAHHTHAA